MSQPIQLSGTTLEGGGQLLRIAVGVSALTKTRIHVTKIRGARLGARGLKQQHLTCVRWLSVASNANTSGAEKKSLELDFLPGESAAILPLEEVIDIGSPGSVSLTLQAILPFLLFSPSQNQEPRHITIKGGVNVDLSPSHEYVQQVLAPNLALIGLPKINVSLGKREWTQKNQATGYVNYTIQSLPSGSTLPAFTLQDRGPLTRIHATIISPLRYESELQYYINSAIRSYTKLGHLSFHSNPDEAKPPVDFTAETPGTTNTIHVLLVAHTTTGHRLGRDQYLSKLASGSTPSASNSKASASGKHTSGKRRSKSHYNHREPASDAVTSESLSALAESVVGDLADELAHGGAVDTFMRDQLVVYQALAQGRSYVDGGRVDKNAGSEGRPKEASLHAKTAEWVCEKLLGQFGVRFDGEGGCEGVGWVVGEGRRELGIGDGRDAQEVERRVDEEVEGLGENLEGMSIQ